MGIARGCEKKIFSVIQVQTLQGGETGKGSISMGLPAFGAQNLPELGFLAQLILKPSGPCCWLFCSPRPLPTWNVTRDPLCGQPSCSTLLPTALHLSEVRLLPSAGSSQVRWVCVGIRSVTA